MSSFAFALAFALRAWSAAAPTARQGRAELDRIVGGDVTAGFHAYAKRDWHGCVESFERALAEGEPADPRLAADLHSTLGACYDELDRGAQAVGHHRRAITVDPRNASAWANLGVSRRLSGRYDLAEEAYERALRLAPDNAVVHANLGAVLVLRGLPGRAVERLRRAVELDERLAAAHANLAVAYARLGRLDDAERELARAEQLGYGGAPSVRAILEGERARPR